MVRASQPHITNGVFVLFCSALEVAPKFAVNQSRPEEITIKEDVGHINFITDDGFGEA